MIKFSGQLSDKVKNWRLNQEIRGKKLIVLLPCAVLSIATIIIALLSNPIHFLWLIAWLTFAIVIGFSPIKDKDLDKILPVEISIYDNIIDCKGSAFNSYRNLDDVKKVVDYGEWYQVIFYFPYKDLRFVCQKDLLVEGTTNEFEKLFEGKIIKK